MLGFFKDNQLLISYVVIPSICDETLVTPKKEKKKPQELRGIFYGLILNSE